MPRRKRTSRPPRASKKKLFVHAFFLLQPFLQFVVLVGVMIALARCSPLSPSTNKKSSLPAATAVLEQGTANTEAQALEDAIQKSFVEIGSDSIVLSTTEDLEESVYKVPHANLPLPDESGIRQLMENRRSPTHTKDRRGLLFLPLSEDQKVSFFENGLVRIDLEELLKSRSKVKARKLLLRYLQNQLTAGAIRATVHLAFDKKEMDIPGLKLKSLVLLGFPGPEKTYIELRRPPAESTETDPNNAALLASVLEENPLLAIVLE